MLSQILNLQTKLNHSNYIFMIKTIYNNFRLLFTRSIYKTNVRINKELERIKTNLYSRVILYIVRKKMFIAIGILLVYIKRYFRKVLT